VEVRLIILHNKIEHDISDYNFPIIYINSSFSLSIFRSNSYQIDEYIQLLNDFKPDVIHSHLFEAEVFTRCYLLNNIKYVSHVHDNIIELKNNNFFSLRTKNELIKWFERKWILNKYTRTGNIFITISNDTKNYIDTNLPKTEGLKFCKLLNAINYKKFSSTKERNIPKVLKLISVGSLVKKKNHTFLIDVVKELNLLSIKTELIILGEGPLREHLENKVKEYNLTSVIHFMGNVTNVQDYLNDATLYVHSATYEPFGLVLLEAMASGLPVVSLDGHGNKDIVIDGYNGYFITQNDPLEMTRRISDIASSDGLYITMSNNAKLFAKDFDIEGYVNQLITIYS
jgi:glycosyltransferase involved in cell wall biosynthesis